MWACDRNVPLTFALQGGRELRPVNHYHVVHHLYQRATLDEILMDSAGITRLNLLWCWINNVIDAADVCRAHTIIIPLAKTIDHWVLSFMFGLLRSSYVRRVIIFRCTRDLPVKNAKLPRGLTAHAEAPAFMRSFHKDPVTVFTTQTISDYTPDELEKIGARMGLIPGPGPILVLHDVMSVRTPNGTIDFDHQASFWYYVHLFTLCVFQWKQTGGTIVATIRHFDEAAAAQPTAGTLFVTNQMHVAWTPIYRLLLDIAHGLPHIIQDAELFARSPFRHRLTDAEAEHVAASVQGIAELYGGIIVELVVQFFLS